MYKCYQNLVEKLINFFYFAVIFFFRSENGFYHLFLWLLSTSISLRICYLHLESNVRSATCSQEAKWSLFRYGYIFDIETNVCAFTQSKYMKFPTEDSIRIIFFSGLRLEKCHANSKKQNRWKARSIFILISVTAGARRSRLHVGSCLWYFNAWLSLHRRVIVKGRRRMWCKTPRDSSISSRENNSEFKFGQG